MEPIFHIVLGGIVVVALTYVLINQSSNVAKVAQGATASYGKVVTDFQGK